MSRQASAKRLATQEILAAEMKPSIHWLATRVAAMCKDKSQAELGRITKLGQGAIGRLARGEGKNPTLDTLDAIAIGVRVPSWALIRPVKDAARTDLEDRAFAIIERIPTPLLPALLRTLEGLDQIAGADEDEVDSPTSRKPRQR